MKVREQKFKVGDKVIANHRAAGNYSETTPGWEGFVVSCEGHYFSARKNEHSMLFSELDENCFDILVEAREPETKLEKKGPIENLKSALGALNIN